MFTNIFCIVLATVHIGSMLWTSIAKNSINFHPLSLELLLASSYIGWCLSSHSNVRLRALEARLAAAATASASEYLETPLAIR